MLLDVLLAVSGLCGSGLGSVRRGSTASGCWDQVRRGPVVVVLCRVSEGFRCLCCVFSRFCFAGRVVGFVGRYAFHVVSWRFLRLWFACSVPCRACGPGTPCLLREDSQPCYQSC